MASVVLDKLAELLFLGFPDIASLASVREHFNTLRHVDPGLGRPARAHLPNRLSVCQFEVGGVGQGS